MTIMDDSNPRKEDTSLGIGWYTQFIDFPDAPDNSDKAIIDTITCYSEVLSHTTSPEEAIAVLDILLSNTQELHRRAQERANT